MGKKDVEGAASAGEPTGEPYYISEQDNPLAEMLKLPAKIQGAPDIEVSPSHHMTWSCQVQERPECAQRTCSAQVL